MTAYLPWAIGIPTALFAWMSLSMFVALAKEKAPEERNRLLRSALGTLVLTVMGLYYLFSFYFFRS